MQQKTYKYLNKKSICFFLAIWLFFLFIKMHSIKAAAVTKRHLVNKQDNKLTTIRAFSKSIEHKQVESQLKANIVSKKHNLLNMSNGNDDTPVWSNAFNFHKSWGTQVDPRTGTLSAYIRVGSLISNLDRGPNITLNIDYNSGSMADPDQLGAGWSWNLTHFNPNNNQLSTSQGQSFILQKNTDGYWWLRYHKLHDIQIDGSKEHHFMITYANGLREILNHDGYEIRLEQQDGRGVNFFYMSGSHALSVISDDEGHKITLTRSENHLTVTSTANDKKAVNIRLYKTEHELHRITLPYGNGKLWQIQFSYIGSLLTQVHYPTGLKKNIDYDCNSAIKLALDYDAQTKKLCAVVQTKITPSTTQPAKIIHYSYDKTNSNEHNYLAFNSGLTMLPGEKQDILFAAPASYTYQTMVDNGIIKQIRTYNKYHLLINTQTINDNNDHLISEIQNFFCRTDRRDGCANTSFKNLPDTYSLPLKIITKDWSEVSNQTSVEIQSNLYDNRGRVISITDAYGRMKKITYCPAQGDAACPAEPDGWTLGSQTESVTRYPAAKVAGSSALYPVITHNYYRKESNINGHGYILVLARKVIQTGNDYLTTANYYYNDSSKPFSYGLLQQQTLTGTTAPGAQLTSLKKDYYYAVNKDHSEKTAYSDIELNNGKFKKSTIKTTSLLTNQVIKKVDAEGKQTLEYHYDHWGRLTEKSISAVSVPIIKENYSYTLSPQLNQMTMTAANGLQQKVIFDGAGHLLKTFAEVITEDGKGKKNSWRPTQSITYDAYGRVTSRVNYLTSQAGNRNKLTTTFDYDVMDRPVHTYLPDGEIAVKQYDNANHCIVSYTKDLFGHYTPLSITHSNILDKPVTQVVLPAFSSRLGDVKQLCLRGYSLPGAQVTTTHYDGFGRVTSVIAPNGSIVTKRYDNSGRIAVIINPRGDKIRYVYNLLGQVIQKWIQPDNDYHQYLLFSARYNAAGELIWEAGEDGKRMLYTYTADGKQATLTTPTGYIISWQYNNLGLPVNKLLNGKVILHTTYDPLSMLPVKKSDITGTTIYTYSDDGKLCQLTHKGENGYPDYHLQWQYNSDRKIISATDVSGNVVQSTYDRFGRISAAYYNSIHQPEKLILEPVYDGLSYVVAIRYGSGMQRTIHYNNYSQQDEVTDTLSGKLLSKWHFSYDNMGNITTLKQSASGNRQGTLNYQYDSLDNLTTVNCSGSSGLPLCPRDNTLKNTDPGNAPVITQQIYTFNPLNRIARVKERLTSTTTMVTLSKVITYSYGGEQAPLRLQKMSTQWNNQTQQINTFTYDMGGNMIIDGEENHLTYNAFNQIIAVETSGGKHSYYAYDGSNREAKSITFGHDIRYLLHRGKSLLGEENMTTDHKINIIGYLGVAKTINGVIDEYYEKNYKNDITAVLNKTTNNNYILKQLNIYSPYGMVWHAQPTNDLPLYQQTLQGFDGEQTDPATGWHFLGSGHRVYNPKQRYFVSEDPVGDGYAFCSNNPVMKTDPSGNSSQGFGKVLCVIDTLGLSVIHKKWATLLGTVLMGGLSTVFCAGIAAWCCAPPQVVALLIAAGVFAGSMGVTAAAVSTNRGLNIASTVAGLTAAIVGLASAAIISFSECPEELCSLEADNMLIQNKQTNIINAVNSDEGALTDSSKQNTLQHSSISKSKISIESDNLNESTEEKEALDAEVLRKHLRAGGGRQILSWCHIDDVIAAVIFIRQNNTGRSGFNVTASNTVTNLGFITFASQLHRSAWQTMSSFTQSVLLGEIPNVFMYEQYVVPTQLLRAGFNFRYLAVTPTFLRPPSELHKLNELFFQGV